MDRKREKAKEANFFVEQILTVCGQALGYETLELSPFVKLKSTEVQVHKLLSVFRQPCIWSKWANYHLEQKPFLAHILGVQRVQLYKHTYSFVIFSLVFVRKDTFLCARVQHAQQCIVGYLSFSTVQSGGNVVNSSMQKSADRQPERVREEGSRGVRLPLKASTALSINFPVLISHSCLLCDATSDTFTHL